MKAIEYYEEQTKRPGKFQNENPLTVYLYEVSMDGDGEILSDDEQDSFFAARFDLTSEERETFKTDEDSYVLIEDSQGFVFTIPFSRFESWKS